MEPCLTRSTQQPEGMDAQRLPWPDTPEHHRPGRRRRTPPVAVALTLGVPTPARRSARQEIREAISQLYTTFLNGVPLRQSLAVLYEQARMSQQKAASAPWPSQTRHTSPQRPPGPQADQRRDRGIHLGAAPHPPDAASAPGLPGGGGQPRDAAQLLELQAAHWSDRPGCPARRLRRCKSARRFCAGPSASGCWAGSGHHRRSWVLGRPIWQELHQDDEARGEKLLLDTCRYG